MNNDDEDSGDKRELKGYGHPPKQHQWPKGKSGNPKGRPKKKKVDYRIGSLLSSIERELYSNSSEAKPVKGWAKRTLRPRLCEPMLPVGSKSGRSGEA